MSASRHSAIRPSTSLQRSIFVSLLFACAVSHAAPEANWPPPPQYSELPTPYGTLAVGPSEYIYEARLVLDGARLEPEIKGLLSILYAFSMPQSQAALVSISKGNESCPVSYRWVILKQDGYTVSPEFGSCSEQIRVSADSRKLTLHTPNPESEDLLDVYVYDGTSIKYATAPSKTKTGASKSAK